VAARRRRGGPGALLGRTAARLHAVALTPSPALPRRDRPIASVDFAALRRRQPRPLLAEAEERVAGLAAAEADVLVHGDLWQGNALWRGDSLAGLVDWDCAGVGPPGVDLGSLRCDAAVCFGMEAANDVRRGWEEEEAGRPDLTRDILVRRRDAFLRDALGRLAAGRG
jgi:aminoglycoside phosphotransferase (APT) family kinase protein